MTRPANGNCGTRLFLSHWLVASYEGANGGGALDTVRGVSHPTGSSISNIETAIFSDPRPDPGSDRNPNPRSTADELHRRLDRHDLAQTDRVPVGQPYAAVRAGL